MFTSAALPRAQQRGPFVDEVDWSDVKMMKDAPGQHRFDAWQSRIAASSREERRPRFAWRLGVNSQVVPVFPPDLLPTNRSKRTYGLAAVPGARGAHTQQPRLARRPNTWGIALAPGSLEPGFMAHDRLDRGARSVSMSRYGELREVAPSAGEMPASFTMLGQAEPLTLVA